MAGSAVDDVVETRKKPNKRNKTHQEPEVGTLNARRKSTSACVQTLPSPRRNAFIAFTFLFLQRSLGGNSY